MGISYKVQTIQGKSSGQDRRVAIVVSQFNDFITKRLLEGCLKELKRCGVKDNNITIVWVSGSLEIPVAALKLARKKNIDAVICLGSVIRGETIHFDLVAEGVCRGVTDVSLLTGKPIIFGVLATETADQATKRSDLKKDHKGRDAATAALEMVEVLKKITYA